LRALSLRNLNVDFKHLVAELSQIEGLKVLNLSGVLSRKKINMKQLALQELQFLNISRL